MTEISHPDVVPRGVGYDTTRERPEGFFITPDTAPAGLSVPRPWWVVPAFLALFAAFSAVVERWSLLLTHRYGHVLIALAAVPAGTFGKQASVAVRPFFIVLALLFATLTSGSVLRRARLLVTTLAAFSLLVLATDLALTRISLYGGPGPFGGIGNMVAGLDGVIALAVGVFAAAALPPGVVVRSERKRPWADVLHLVLLVAVGIAVTWSISHYWHNALAGTSRIPLLGGIASLIVIFFGIFPLVLYLLDMARRRPRRRRATGGPLPIGVIVPARNEAGLIGDCVRAIDRAAGGYPGRCTIYVIENGSSDATYEETRAAIARARYVRGVVLRCEPKGKAHALNVGLRHVTEDIVLRIDADTLVTQSVLHSLARPFGDPAVGGVSGMPLPRVQSSWICRMRAIEVYYQVGFKRTGYDAVDAIGVLPGALVAYRRSVLARLNGFAEGVNGEDADMTVRVGRLGYRIASDPSIRAYTEMPSTFAYLREQRMRWARGTYHMLARNKSGIVMRQGLRCVWMLPWAGFIMFRRLMILPFAATGVLLVALTHSSAPLRAIAAGGAITLGVQLIQMAVCMVVLGDFRLVADIPGYLVFRLIVSYFALETLFGLAFRPIDLNHDRRGGTTYADPDSRRRWIPWLADRHAPVSPGERSSPGG